MDKPRPFWMPDTKGFLAIIIVAIFAACVFILMFKQGPADTTIFAVLTTLLGVLAGVIKDVYGYHFGSSASSSSKDDTISKMLPPAAPAAPVVTDWWSKLTDAERKPIEDAATAGDTRATKFMIAAKAGTADTGDLAYVSTKGWITQARASEIVAS